MKVASRLNVKAIAEAYVQSFDALIDHLDLRAIERAVELVQAARDSGATIYVAGNGGSAATAIHWANDLTMAVKRSGRLPPRVVSLVDNISSVTALANDEGYERVFAAQLENLAQPGDMLVVFSASGNSLNLVRAVETAQDRGMATVAFLGFDGGKLKDMVTAAIWVETDIGAYGLAETAHVLIADIIATCLSGDRRL
jgi:D-sedoheptulose 7-phosphate isomerase